MECFLPPMSSLKAPTTFGLAIMINCTISASFDLFVGNFSSFPNKTKISIRTPYVVADKNVVHMLDSDNATQEEFLTLKKD